VFLNEDELEEGGQSCYAHFMRGALAHVSMGLRQMIAATQYESQ
jgi:hypothetical protein